MATNLFHNNTKAIPMKKPDDFIIRVPMTELEIGGRTDHVPAGNKNQAMISHVPNRN